MLERLLNDILVLKLNSIAGEVLQIARSEWEKCALGSIGRSLLDVKCKVDVVIYFIHVNLIPVINDSVRIHLGLRRVHVSQLNRRQKVKELQNCMVV